MRLSFAILFAATATLLTSGKTAVADTVRNSDILTMASPDAVGTIGTAQDMGGDKRFLRYHDNDDEERGKGLFDASRLEALMREADGLGYTQLQGTGVKRFFKTLTSKYNPVNVPIPDEYSTLRTLYHSWYYNHYVPKHG
ncbi:RxLR effector protein [Phytophthora megakarya]|uniref:RxLR effector protein n=1 Tax=Phytophthora megakarya TaxID=4795 RepID=A0A225V147_9STRA|nr:RxLR effector protein [Phytophthora megakarya]